MYKTAKHPVLYEQNITNCDTFMNFERILAQKRGFSCSIHRWLSCYFVMSDFTEGFS